MAKFMMMCPTAYIHKEKLLKFLEDYYSYEKQGMKVPYTVCMSDPDWYVTVWEFRSQECTEFSIDEDSDTGEYSMGGVQEQYLSNSMKTPDQWNTFIMQKACERYERAQKNHEAMEKRRAKQAEEKPIVETVT